MSDRLAEIQRHIDTEPVTLYGLDVAELASLCIQVDEDRTWLLARVRELGADNERLQTLCGNLAKTGGKHAHEEARLRGRVAELEAQAERDAAVVEAQRRCLEVIEYSGQSSQQALQARIRLRAALAERDAAK